MDAFCNGRVLNWATCTKLIVASSAVIIVTSGFRRWAHWLLSRVRYHPQLQPQIWDTCDINRADVERFGRQIILPKLGVVGQRSILQSSVLVIGAGGLGCPVAIYLCAAGIGRLGIVDDDEVATSNLHRQIAHSMRRLGHNKAKSLQHACLELRDSATIEVHTHRITEITEAVRLLSSYDLIIDCTDAPSSRYLINDAALKAVKPLLAVSAVGLSGQLAFYNLDGGPCLRCIFPHMPGADAEESVASCAENGVLGPVPGILGTLAAIEALKLLAGPPLANTCIRGRMLMYDALDPTSPCRTMKISRKADCGGCGSQANFAPAVSSCVSCRAAVNAKQSQGLGLAANEMRACLACGERLVIIDVRQASHFAVSHLSDAQNWPLATLSRTSDDELHRRVRQLQAAVNNEFQQERRIVCVCRRGNDSMRAVHRLRAAGIEAWNLNGGLMAFIGATCSAADAPPLT